MNEVTLKCWSWMLEEHLISLPLDVKEPHLTDGYQHLCLPNRSFVNITKLNSFQTLFNSSHVNSPSKKHLNYFMLWY